jgi:hypothetical protein
LLHPCYFTTERKKDSGKGKVAITAVLANLGWDCATYSNNNSVAFFFIYSYSIKGNRYYGGGVRRGRGRGRCNLPSPA